MAQDDVLFEEDSAPDEEVLSWAVSEDQDGIEIALDCTKCQASVPFLIYWEDLLKLGNNQKVKGFAKSGSGFAYRYTCPHCLHNFKGHCTDSDAQKEATSTVVIGMEEFDAWNRQAQGRLRQGSKRQQKAQQHVAQQQAQHQTQQPVAPRPAQQPRRQLTPQQTSAVKAYSRDLQQKGYSAVQIQQMRRVFLAKMLKGQAAQQRPQQAQLPTLPEGFRYMRRKADGHRVVIDPQGNVVKDLGLA